LIDKKQKGYIKELIIKGDIDFQDIVDRYHKTGDSEELLGTY
jgi:hypothetical protein